MKPITLLHDTKRAYIYSYGNGGKITVSKRFKLQDEIDLVEAIDEQMIDVTNAMDTKTTISIADLAIDERAFAAIDLILEHLGEAVITD